MNHLSGLVYHNSNKEHRLACFGLDSMDFREASQSEGEESEKSEGRKKQQPGPSGEAGDRLVQLEKALQQVEKADRPKENQTKEKCVNVVLEKFELKDVRAFIDAKVMIRGKTADVQIVSRKDPTVVVWKGTVSVEDGLVTGAVDGKALRIVESQRKEHMDALKNYKELPYDKRLEITRLVGNQLGLNPTLPFSMRVQADRENGDLSCTIVDTQTQKLLGTVTLDSKGRLAENSRRELNIKSAEQMLTLRTKWLTEVVTDLRLKDMKFTLSVPGTVVASTDPLEEQGLYLNGKYMTSIVAGVDRGTVLDKPNGMYEVIARTGAKVFTEKGFKDQVQKAIEYQLKKPKNEKE
jgi:hypothetical protein